MDLRVGHIVRPKEKFTRFVPFDEGTLKEGREKEVWIGIVIDFDEGDPIVFWDEDYHSEIEYAHQLEVIGESSNKCT
tara:strand:+ start:203 stop:433 length:231 start_codon:yes stop_codon:yes gene_type:complete